MDKSKKVSNEKRKRKLDSVGDPKKKTVRFEGEGAADETPPAEGLDKVAPEAEAGGERYREYYLDGYCRRDGGSEQYYARNESGDEYYWRDSADAQRYAVKIKEEGGVAVGKMEYPATARDEKPSYISERAGRPRYPVNLVDDGIIFPRDPVTGEEAYLPDAMGNLFYPENKYGRQFYRKDAEGNEVVLDGAYAQLANGTQIYPKKADGDEFYVRVDDRDVPAVRKSEGVAKPYYARTRDGSEIYPREYLD